MPWMLPDHTPCQSMPDTSPTPHAFADRARQPWARFILPLLALSLIIAGLGTLAYRCLLYTSDAAEKRIV